ncbi:hypothetical protein BC835DRAFT_478087 [Cytidiella melzeri]|nr:hypothetical protein BC835DRAFT_487419 [Cytidiella melzeri]KAI0700061.1 hypothetical protein BC835DRAFT_478087 [Cytidiella melzeri]
MVLARCAYGTKELVDTVSDPYLTNQVHPQISNFARTSFAHSLFYSRPLPRATSQHAFGTSLIPKHRTKSTINKQDNALSDTAICPRRSHLTIVSVSQLQHERDAETKDVRYRKQRKKTNTHPCVSSVSVCQLSVSVTGTITTTDTERNASNPSSPPPHNIPQDQNMIRNDCFYVALCVSWTVFRCC